MPNTYKNLRVHEVSLVDRAANKRKFAVLKSEDSLNDENDGGSPPNNEPSEEIIMNEEEIQALVASQVAEALKAQEQQLITKAAADQEEAINKAKEAAETELKKRDSLIETLTKAEDVRKEKEFIAKAESLVGLGLDAEFGKLLKSVSETCPEEYSKIEEVLVKASETIAKKDLLEEVGAVGESEGGVADKIELEATRLKEEDSSLSHAQAVTKALELNPSLYTEYLKGA